jgi:hypothetical protein
MDEADALCDRIAIMNGRGRDEEYDSEADQADGESLHRNLSE